MLTLSKGKWVNDEIMNAFVSITQTSAFQSLNQSGKVNVSISSFFFKYLFPNGIHVPNTTVNNNDNSSVRYGKCHSFFKNVDIYF